jgi:hypothetical protein
VLGASLSPEGLEKRDRSLFEKGRAGHIPVALTLAGGYAGRVEDAIQIQSKTIRVAKGLARCRTARDIAPHGEPWPGFMTATTTPE